MGKGLGDRKMGYSEIPRLKSQSVHKNDILTSLFKTTHTLFPLEDAGRLRKADCVRSGNHIPWGDGYK